MLKEVFESIDALAQNFDGLFLGEESSFFYIGVEIAVVTIL